MGSLGGEMSEVDFATDLCTRLCHDLAGSVGAVVAGTELIEDEDDPAQIRETASLLTRAAEAVAIRLRFLRLAFGTASTESLPRDDLPRLTSQWAEVAAPGVSVRWIEDGQRFRLSGKHIQMALCMFLLAVERLPRGGVVEICPAEGGIQVTASGPTLRPAPEITRILSGQTTFSGPRQAPIFLLHQLVQQDTASFSVESTDSQITFLLTLSRVACE